MRNCTMGQSFKKVESHCSKQSSFPKSLLPWFVSSYCCDKHHDLKQLGEESLFHLKAHHQIRVFKHEIGTEEAA